jgi:hypothetical protein
MKTFREFVIEATARRQPRYPGESLQDYIKRVKGIKDHPDAKIADTPGAADPRTTGEKTTKISKDVFTKNKKPSSSSRPIQKPPAGGATPPKGGPLTKAEPAGKLSTDVRTTSTKPIKNPLKGLKSGSVLSGAIDTALEKSKGSGWARSLAKGTTTALGTLAGAKLGTFAGPVGTVAGSIAGQQAASKAFDVAAGANAKERAEMRKEKRQSQAGGGLKGIGGETTFDTKKGTMTTGSGSQKKTVELAKKSVVKDPKTGKAEVGYLAYKDGKAVYKRADTSNAALAKTSSNPLERVGRTLFAGAYKEHDAKQKAEKLKQAAQSDIKRQQALGVKGSKNLVGPKIVGPKIVGPKPSPTSNK